MSSFEYACPHCTAVMYEEIGSDLERGQEYLFWRQCEVCNQYAGFTHVAGSDVICVDKISVVTFRQLNNDKSAIGAIIDRIDRTGVRFISYDTRFLLREINNWWRDHRASVVWIRRQELDDFHVDLLSKPPEHC